jgi:hypothetical protein
MTKNQSQADTNEHRPVGAASVTHVLLKGDESCMSGRWLRISVLDTGWSWLS